MTTEDRSPITSISYDKWRGLAYVFSGTGDTYAVSSIPQSYGKYGPSIIFSSIDDGNGDKTDTVSFNLVYELFDAVVAATVGVDGYSAFKQVGAYSAESKGVAKGKYVSRVLSAGDGFGYWGDISWVQSTPGNSVVEVSVKVADDPSLLTSMPWMYKIGMKESYQYGNRISVPLDRFNLRGRFMVFMVELVTELRTDVPYVANLDVSYFGSHSVYFFSDAIRISSGYPENLILIASMSVPKKTQVLFGVGPGGSGDWKDYVPIELDRISSIPKSFGRRFKVGARLSSYDLTDVPVINEFALSFEAPTDNEVNQ